MVFSSIVFLLFFLPIVLIVYHTLFLPVSLKHKKATIWRHLANLCLLSFSLLFYFWGEGWFVWIIIASTCIDFFCGLLISGASPQGENRNASRWWTPHGPTAHGAWLLYFLKSGVPLIL